MKFIIFCVVSVICLSAVAFGQESAEVRAEDKYSYLSGLSYIDTMSQRIKQHFKKNKIDLNFFAGVLQGYDNNVNLDPDRKKDGFLQSSLNTELIYNYTNDVRLKAENDTTYIKYYKVNDADLLDIYDTIGLEADVFDDLFTLGTDYVLDLVIFPHDEDGTYMDNQARAYMKQDIIFNLLYHEAGYEFSIKNYSHNKVLGSNKVRTSQLREDLRHTVDYEVGMYLFNKAILKTKLEFYRNDSNYQYYDFYDYWSFKVRPSFILMLTNKLYASSSFTYQQRRYDDRLSSEDDEHVYDDTYSFNVSVLYDISKALTLAVNYSYRENSSNDPLQKYSGSILTGGIYYAF